MLRLPLPTRRYYLCGLVVLKTQVAPFKQKEYDVTCVQSAPDSMDCDNPKAGHSAQKGAIYTYPGLVT